MWVFLLLSEILGFIFFDFFLLNVTSALIIETKFRNTISPRKSHTAHSKPFQFDASHFSSTQVTLVRRKSFLFGASHFSTAQVIAVQRKSLQFNKNYFSSAQVTSIRRQSL